MSDRQRAIEILQRARDLLAERLTERILQSHEAILEDALGLSYLSEIEALYEQFGARLHHLNAMISGLPQEALHRAEQDAARPDPEVQPRVRLARALPPPKPVAGLLALAPPLTLDTFVVQIQAGMVDAAAATLAELFELDPLRAARCARAFHEKHRRQGNVLAKTAQLQKVLATGEVNRSLLLLYECFELYGGELISALHALKARLAAA